MSGHSTPSSWGMWLWKKTKNTAKGIWGDFESWEEIQKFALLGIVFFFVIGVYWALRAIKDPVFNKFIDTEAYQPVAKVVSMFVIFPLVIFYSKLIDMFKRDRVFYVLMSIYASLAFLFFAIFNYHPTYGLATVVQSPYNLIGWAWYVYVESFGSLIVALFWALTSDITTPESARRGFPLIVVLGQLGNIVGPRYLRAGTFGSATSAPVVALSGFLMICAAAVLFVFMRVTPPRLLKGYHGKDESAKEKEQEPGFFEGLRILVSNSYLLGIFFAVTTFEIITTFFDYNFKVTIMNTFATEVEQSAYSGDYAVTVGIVAFLSLVLGISNIQRWFGMTTALLLLPLLMLVAVYSLYAYPSKLGLLFWIMVFSKAVNYALNSPTLKQLYIPTTHDTKYKAMAWSEMFGSRGAKAFSSFVNYTRKAYFIKSFGPLSGASHFIMMTSFFSFGMIGVWFFVAMYIAKTYNTAIKENRVVC